MKFHPAAQILTWSLLVASLQLLAFDLLLSVVGVTVLAALAISRVRFYQLLRRTRWIFLSLLTIYAYTTPGQPLAEMLGAFGPSREGLHDGALQLSRLLATLAGLAMLLDNLPRQQLIAGLYTLLAPLQLLGLSRERCAVRLALTLHYAERALSRKNNNGLNILRSLERDYQEESAADCRPVELEQSRFAIADALLLSAAMLALWLSM